jgi:hypothetical protein
VRLWPRAWREAYGDQLADDLDAHGYRTADLADVAWRGVVCRIANRRPAGAAVVALAGGGSAPEDPLAVAPRARMTGAATVLLVAQAALSSGSIAVLYLEVFAGPLRTALQVLGTALVVLAFACCALGVVGGLVGMLVRHVRAEAVGLLASAPLACLLQAAVWVFAQRWLLVVAQ